MDALSRNPIMFAESVLTKLIKDRQDSDDPIKAIKAVLQSQSDYDGYVILNNVFYKQIRGQNLLVIPDVLQTEVIRNVHENGYIGSEKMEEDGVRNKMWKKRDF